MAVYSLIESGVIRAQDGAIIPDDPANRDWQAYQDWIAEGNTADPESAASPPEQAAVELASRIVAGIAITATSPAPADLAATYALDDITVNQIKGVANDSFNMGLPGGLSTFSYPDMSGTPRTFTGPQLVQLYKAMRDLLFVLDQQAAIMAHGGQPQWPAQTGTISVA